MAAGAVSIGLSGIAAGVARLRSSAHNAANSLTENFRNHRARQVEERGGGTRAVTSVDADPEPVDLAGEIVEQMLAELQVKSSARAVETALDLRGTLLDILA